MLSLLLFLRLLRLSLLSRFAHANPNYRRHRQVTKTFLDPAFYRVIHAAYRKLSENPTIICISCVPVNQGENVTRYWRMFEYNGNDKKVV